MYSSHVYSSPPNPGLHRRRKISRQKLAFRPPWGGAQQAYQDYLNGKFDSSGNRTPQTEPPADTEPPVTDKPDPPGEDKPSSDKDKKPGGSSGGDNPSSDETDTGSGSETESMESASDEMETASTDSNFAPESESKTAKSKNIMKKASAFTEAAPLIIGPGLVAVIGGILLAVKWKKR